MAKKQRLDPQKPDDAKTILSMFVVRARRVKEHSMVKDGFIYRFRRPKITIHLMPSSVTAEDVFPANEEIMESLASRLRPCIVSQEPIFLPTVFQCLHTILDTHLSDEEKSKLKDFEDSFEHAYSKNDVILYQSQVMNSDGQIIADLTDRELAESWLYIDSVHSEPIGWKTQGLKYTYSQRYFAATSFFSYLAALVVDLLKYVDDLHNVHDTGISSDTWTSQVIADSGQMGKDIVSQRIFVAPHGTPMPDGLDPKTSPAFQELTLGFALAESMPIRARVELLDQNNEIVESFNAKCKCEADSVKVLVEKNLLLTYPFEGDPRSGDDLRFGMAPARLIEEGILEENDLYRKIEQAPQVRIVISVNGEDRPLLITRRIEIKVNREDN